VKPGRSPDGEGTARADSPPTTAESSPFVISPYLQYPTQTQIAVMWETAVAGTSVVEFGPTPTALKTSEGDKDVTIHEVKIEGLEPETKYVYRVSTTTADGKTVTSPFYQFMTAVREGSAFSFAVIGDTQN